MQREVENRREMPRITSRLMANTRGNREPAINPETPFPAVFNTSSRTMAHGGGNVYITAKSIWRKTRANDVVENL